MDLLNLETKPQLHRARSRLVVRFARFASFLVRKQSARCPGTFRTQARPAPARALTPRPRWKLTLAVTVPGTWHLHQPEFRTNSRRANAGASQPSIHLSRATGAPPCLPGWCRVVAVTARDRQPLREAFFSQSSQRGVAWLQ